MAEEEKEEGGDKGGDDFWGGFWVTVVVGFILLNIIGYIGTRSFRNGVIYQNYIVPIFKDVVAFFIIASNALSVFFLVVVIYCLIKLAQVENLERGKYYATEPPPSEDITPKNERWERVVQHISSDNPSDWRLAILEADIILDELLDRLGYIGDTIGDKLKKVVRGDFKTLDNAWEAHRIRNAIAHEGSDFALTQRESRRIIGLYETVFREFDHIVWGGPTKAPPESFADSDGQVGL